MMHKGWKNEGWRHSLAARGIKTNNQFFAKKKKFMVPPRTKESDERYPVKGDGDHRHDEKNPFGIHRHEDVWLELDELKEKQKVLEKKIKK